MAAAPSSARKATAWVQITSIPLKRQFGEFPERVQQRTFGRLRLDDVARVTSAVIGDKQVRGDLLLIKGRYQNLSSQPTYWSEGAAFEITPALRRCTVDTCGPALPKGDWRLPPAESAPIVDYPDGRTVPPGATVSFRQAIHLPAGAATSVRSLRDLWLVPLYTALNAYDLPYDQAQLIRLATYFGRSELPTSTGR